MLAHQILSARLSSCELADKCGLCGVKLGGATLSFTFEVGAAAQLSGGSAHCRLDAEHEVRSRAPKKTADSEVLHNPIALLSQSKIKLWRLQVRTQKEFHLPSLFVVLKGRRVAERVYFGFQCTRTCLPVFLTRRRRNASVWKGRFGQATCLVCYQETLTVSIVLRLTSSEQTLHFYGIHFRKRKERR